MISDSVVAKEKLSGLTEIDSAAISNMTDNQLFSYVQALNVTTAAFPLQKDELVHAFNEKDYATVFQWLQVIGSSLSQMHADKLAKECEKHVDLNKDLENVRHVRVKVFLDYFIPTLDLFVTDVHQVLEDLDALDDIDKLEQHIEDFSPENVKEKILTVSDLDSDRIKKMSDDELSDYLKHLNSFESDSKSQETGLRGAIKIKHYVFVFQWLAAIEETLTKLHAVQLANDCKNQISANKDFNNIRHEKLDVFVNYLISSLQMLSADIKALHLPTEIVKAGDKDGGTSHIAVEVEVLSQGSSPDAKSILIINKMTMFMNSFKNALGDVGHKLIGVTTAESAIGYLKTAKPDLFIID